MVKPCEVTDAGETVRSLARAYVANNSCIQQYQLLIESQVKWKADQLKIYSPQIKK